VQHSAKRATNLQQAVSLALVQTALYRVAPAYQVTSVALLEMLWVPVRPFNALRVLVKTVLTAATASNVLASDARCHLVPALLASTIRQGSATVNLL
jgi:hypothetical protein